MTTPKNRRKRGKPTDRTPPGKSKKSKESEVYLICDIVIRDGDDPDDVLYCEGDCQGWLHRKCVCMTKKRYVARANLMTLTCALIVLLRSMNRKLIV